MRITFLAILLFVNTANSQCLDEYRKAKNKAGWAVGIAPVAGLVGLTGSAVLAFNWEYAGWNKAALGALEPVLEVAVSHVIPGAIIVGTLAYETHAIIRYTKTKRAYHMLNDLMGNGNGESFEQFVQKLQQQYPEIPYAFIRNQILEADSKEDLCNGKWSGRKRRKIAYLKEIQAQIVKKHGMETHKPLVR